MDKTLTEHNGGIPFDKDQERFDLNAIRDGIDALSRSLVGGKEVGIMARLFGVVVSEDVNNINVTAGAVIINGEIRKVDAQVIAKNANKAYVWDEYTYSPVSERKNDLNAVAFDLYQYRRARLIELDDTDPNLGDYVEYNDLKDLKGFQSDWIAIPAGGGGSDWSLTSINHAQYFKDPSGNVHVDFHIKWDVASTTLTFFTLPAGFRPQNTLQFPISQGGTLIVSPNGLMLITQDPKPDHGVGYVTFRSDN